MKRMSVGMGAMTALLASSVTVFAGSHTWRFSEVFSDASGTVQFIEFKCDISGENFVGSLQVTTGNGMFTFPSHLPGSTENKKLLLATPAFAALPGAPTPDFTIPANFIPLGGGLIRYNPAGNYDTWAYGPGDIPTDGVNSVQFTSFLCCSGVDTFITAVNNPTNYQGGSGSVNAGCVDNDGDGFGDPGSPACSGGPATDCNDNDPAAFPGGVEEDVGGKCADGSDNDCDALVDCLDVADCGAAVPECVPTVSEWGVAVLTLLMLNFGSLVIRQRA